MRWFVKVWEFVQQFLQHRFRLRSRRYARPVRTLALYWLLGLHTINTLFALAITAVAVITKSPGLTTVGLLLLVWTVGRTGKMLRELL